MDTKLVKILEEYLKDKYNYSEVEIRSHDIQGSECVTYFWADNFKNNLEVKVINIWDMLLFLNDK